MARDGGPLFGGRSVGDLRRSVLADIRERAAHLDPESPSDIPETMFLVGVLGQYDLTLPDLHFERVFSRDVQIDGRPHLEIHLPMAGKPRNLHLSPPGPDLDPDVATALEYQFVDGDCCLQLPLEEDSPADVDLATDELLALAEDRYQRVRRELEALRQEAYETAVDRYRRETRSRGSGFTV